MGGPWRLLDDLSPADGATNMAVDAALLDAVAAGAPPAVRLYRWAPATLSFGRNQPTRGLYDQPAAAERGIHFVRRPTGGQAVLHDDELTYAVVASVETIGKPRAAYERINRALVAGLRGLGLPVELAEGGGEGPGAPIAPTSGAADRRRQDPSASADWRTACFRTPARGEVVAGGRKLVGSAQRTQDRVILQHGSILLGGSQAPAEELLLEPVSTPAGGWTTVEVELGRRPAPARVREALISGFENAFGIQLAPTLLSEPERRASEGWCARFASPEWTWRR